jgi:trimeric autotransporter adhesin
VSVAKAPFANEVGAVGTLAALGSTVYAGGQFTRIGGRARSYIGALDATTARATAWNPQLNMFGTFALAVSGSIL